MREGMEKGVVIKNGIDKIVNVMVLFFYLFCVIIEVY